MPPPEHPFFEPHSDHEPEVDMVTGAPLTPGAGPAPFWASDDGPSPAEAPAAFPPPPPSRPDPRAEAERAQSEADRLAADARDLMPEASPGHPPDRLAASRYWQAKGAAERAGAQADYWAGAAYSAEDRAGTAHWRLSPEEKELAESDWWQRRDELYRARPDVAAKTAGARALRAPREEELAARQAELAQKGTAAGADRDEYRRAVDELTRLRNAPATRDPSAREDPYEQEAFNRRFHGRPDPERAERAAADAVQARGRLASAGLGTSQDGPVRAQRRSPDTEFALQAVLRGLDRAAGTVQPPGRDRGRPRRFGLPFGRGRGR